MISPFVRFARSLGLPVDPGAISPGSDLPLVQPSTTYALTVVVHAVRVIGVLGVGRSYTGVMCFTWAGMGLGEIWR